MRISLKSNVAIYFDFEENAKDMLLNMDIQYIHHFTDNFMNIEKRGRKNEGKVQVCYRLAPDVVKFLREHDRPASRLIEDAVRAHYKVNGR